MTYNQKIECRRCHNTVSKSLLRGEYCIACQWLNRDKEPVKVNEEFDLIILNSNKLKDKTELERLGRERVLTK